MGSEADGAKPDPKLRQEQGGQSVLVMYTAADGDQCRVAKVKGRRS